MEDKSSSPPVLVLKKGKLKISQREWEVVPSGRSSLEENHGRHYILDFEEETEENVSSAVEQEELISLSLWIAQELSSRQGNPGGWRIEVNGSALKTRNTFHVHIICLNTGVKARRSTDPIVVA